MIHVIVVTFVVIGKLIAVASFETILLVKSVFRIILILFCLFNIHCGGI